MCLFELWFSLGMCPVVGLLGHMIILFLIFSGTSILFSIVAKAIYIPINSVKVSFFCISSPMLVISCLLNYSHSNRCEMYLIVVFFSSRRRHTRSWCDWSSDVCSSDLLTPVRMAIIKKTRDNKHWWGHTEKGNFYTVDGNVNCFSHYGKQYGGSWEN